MLDCPYFSKCQKDTLFNVYNGFSRIQCRQYTLVIGHLCNFSCIMCKSVPLNSCSSSRPAKFTVSLLFHPKGIPLKLEKLFMLWGLPRHTGARTAKSSPEILFQSFQFYKGQKKTLHIAWVDLLVYSRRQNAFNPKVTAVPEKTLLRISRFIL